MSEEIGKALKDYRKIVDKDFEKYENCSRFCMKQSNKLSKIADDTNNMFKFRLVDVVSKSDLELLSSVIAMQSKLQSDLATISHKDIVDMKEVVYQLVKIPLELMVKTLSVFVEATPKLSLEVRKMMEEKLGTLEKEVQHLKENKEKITLEISSEYDKALKELTERIVRAKKAQKSYVG